MDLCRYKDALGVPGQGLHAARLGRFALWDVVGTVAGGWALARYMRWSVPVTVAGTFLTGHALHLLFCVDTAAVRMLHSS